MLKTLKIFTVALALTTFISCSKDKKEDNNITFKATLSGASEVPANTSKATGNATLTYDKSTKMFTIVTTYSSDLKPVGGHIHKAEAGVNGAVIFTFSNLTSPITFKSEISDEQLKALEAGTMYVNLHSETFPGGEIRGQLKKQ